MTEKFEIFEGTLNKYNGNETIIQIPKTVISIGDFAFYGSENIEEIHLHDGITSIGSFAFYGCSKIKEMHIPNSVTLIGPGAFSWCSQLTHITIPDSVRVINKSSFFRCTALNEVILPDTLTAIEHSAFGYCRQLETIQLPSSLKHIGDNAFEHCLALKSITLPDAVETLGKKVFINCTNLHELRLSKGLKEVGLSAFETYSQITIESNDTLLVSPMMFDEYYNFDVKSKNDGHFLFSNSYFPIVEFEKWKKIAKIILLVNFLETYDKHQDKMMYLDKCERYKDELVAYLMKEKRYIPINVALENHIITSIDLEPYFDSVTDREQKAKLLEYKNKETTSTSIFDDLEDELLNMF